MSNLATQEFNKEEYAVTFDRERAIATALRPSTHFDFKTTCFEHQKVAFDHGVATKKFLLGDDQGLGKTKEAIDLAVYHKLNNGVEYCLVVCGVNGLKSNWVREIIKHSDETHHMLGRRVGAWGKVYPGCTKDKVDDLDKIESGEIKDFFIITNVESLRSKEMQEKLFELTNTGTIGMVVIDEIHKACNAESKQGQAINCLQSEYRMALTGTPLMNRPTDLFVPLKWLEQEKNTFYYFRNRYCQMGGRGGHGIVGYKNLSELEINLNKVMLRRKKEDVLEFLPPKIYQEEKVIMNAKQAQIYDEIRQCILANLHQIKLSPNPLAQLIRLRQATGHTAILSRTIRESAKVDRLKQMLEEITAAGHKAIVFTNWVQMTNILSEELAEYNPAVLTGQTPDKDEQMERFQNDPDCKIIMGTIKALGTGFTLTAASYVFFVDSPWNNSNKEQAIDRAHRIGSEIHQCVNIVTLVTEGTIDMRIEEIVEQKKQLAQAIVEGDEEAIKRLTFDSESLIDILLS